MKTGNFFILGIALLLAGPFAFSAPKKTLDVGVVLRLDDKYNDSVSALVTGIETAKIVFEASHPGVNIVLHRYSHVEDLESVVAAANRVIKDKIPATIGGELSEESFVLRDKLGPQKLVFITPTSSNPAVTEGQSYAFRACFSDRLVAVQLANFTIDHLKPTSMGVLHNVSSPYTDFLSKQFIETFQSRMVSSKQSVPIHEEKIRRDTIDFDAQITNFMDKKVTHLAVLTHETDLMRFVIQASKKGFFPTYVGSDGWGSNDGLYTDIVKEAPQGERFVGFRNSYWKEDNDSKISRQFLQQFEKSFKHKPTAWSAIAFDTAWVLFTAMIKAHDPKNSDDIRKELKSLKNIQLVTSESFTFGPDNSPRKDLFIYRIDKTGVHYEATLK